MQINFAKSIGGDAALIQKAEDALANAVDLKETVAEIEAILQPLSKEAKTFTIHCVGHGHIDMNWMWSWPETCATTHDTFASVLSLMEQYPELTYSQSQASVYALIEKHHPDMFAQIQQRVKEGRWEITAAHWVEGDKNISSGESLARHLLYTRNYIQEKFGLGPDDLQVDWEPDTFGHANTIPSILVQGGVKYYYSCRTGGGYEHPRVGDDRPPLFWWQSPTGDRVLVNKETTWYNSYVNIGEDFSAPAVAFYEATGLKDWLNVYGIGNHGGGPTRIEIDYFLETRDWPIWPNVIFGTSQKWFRLVEKQIADLKLDIPVLDHELNFEFTGCYTSQSAIKRANRFGENYCVEAETLAALAPRPDDLPKLRDAWLNVLFNQFHDILPGSGVAATREHALGIFQETAAITGAMKRNALQALIKDIDTASLLPDTPEGQEERALMEAGKANTPFVAGAGLGAMMSGISTASGGGKRFLPYVVYNPCAWERSEIVEVILYDIEMDPTRIVVRDEEGFQHPVLITDQSAVWNHAWGHKKTTLIFLARDLPSLGYKTFLFCEGDVTADIEPVVPIEGFMFETPELEVHFDRFRPSLAGVLQLGSEAIIGGVGLNRWRYVTEKPRGMTAWAIGGLDDKGVDLEASSFRVEGLAQNEGTSQRAGRAFAIRTTSQLVVPGTESTVRLHAVLSGHAPRIDFEAHIDWREIGTPERGIPGLEIGFKTNLSQIGQPIYRFETPFGAIARPDIPDDVPTLRYAHLTGVTPTMGSFLASAGQEGDAFESSSPVGMTILQDSKYGHRAEDSEITMRVVRSSFDPDHAPEVGKQVVRYSIVFHEGDTFTSELTRLGAAFNHPPIVVPALLQAGTGDPTKSFVAVGSGSVILSCLKQAEDGKGLIVRLTEYDAISAEAKVWLAPELLAGITKVETVDLLERPVKGKASLKGSVLTVSVPAKSTVTVRLS